VDWRELPPQARAERVPLKRGASIIVYHVPHVREGPVVRTGADGKRHVEYMYAHFVFRWVEGESRASIYHGTLDGERLALPWTLTLDGAWCSETLARGGREWVRAHLARFRP
jgi:hypothetical protein